MPDDVSFEVERLGTHSVVRPTGYLDISTSPRLREALRDLPVGSEGAVILDLSSIEFLDSSALGVILSAWKHLQAEDAKLLVVSPQAPITKIFEVTGLTLSINLYSSLEEADADLGV